MFDDAAKLRRFAVNHATVGFHVSFDRFLDECARTGATSVGIWRDYLDGSGASVVRKMLADRHLSVTSLNRTGFFGVRDVSERESRLNDARRAIDFCAEVGISTLLVVPGGPERGEVDLAGTRSRIEECLHVIAPAAEAAGVRLGLEPFHPSYVRGYGSICTLRSALDVSDRVGEALGVILDVYHLWWDPDRTSQVARAGNRILGYHVCDMKAEPKDPAYDRAIMGEGIADVVGLTGEVLAAGYGGGIEVEIFSRDLWRMEPEDVLECVRARFLTDTFPG